ncbi:MAG: cytochrome c, partial [Steroidobacteraceae bacterium]
MKFMNKLGLAVAVAAVSAIGIAQNAGTPAKSAAEAKAVIESRQKLFEDMKKTMEPIGAMLKRQREIDPAVIATNAAHLKELAGKIPGQFAVDTRQFKDTKTDALDGIWASQADFKAKADVLANAAQNAITVSAGGDKG